METLSSQQIQERYHLVLTRIAEAAIKSGRDPDEVQLMVVTKGHPLGTVRAVVDAGARILGENYVEEAVEKIEAFGNPNIEWHMIGHLQSRKARLVCQYFTCLHSLDRIKIARRLDQSASEMGKVLPVLIECNLSGEETKFGYPLWEESAWPEFVGEVAALLEFPHLEIRGLITMPPYHSDPENSRPYFQKLCRLREFLVDHFPKTNWRELSMGMSNDYEIAVEEGATILRVGTAIVGSRT
jgi:pyridoxal phosphate enzyme (YggS family)